MAARPDTAAAAGVGVAARTVNVPGCKNLATA
jgi:hypothetical protein